MHRTGKDPFGIASACSSPGNIDNDEIYPSENQQSLAFVSSQARLESLMQTAQKANKRKP